MFAWLVFASALSDASNIEPPAPPATQQMEPYLLGLTPAEAKVLIAKLQQAQQQVRAGKKQTVEILAGAPAIYAAARVAPLTTFLLMSFDRPRSIERKAAMGLWQPYELTYFPPGPHSLMWKVTATVGLTGELVRVEMLYTAPPPF